MWSHESIYFLLSHNKKKMGVRQNVCVCGADSGTEKAHHKVMSNWGSINESEFPMD